MNVHSERIERTVFIETCRSQSDIRNTFAQCGKIYGLYPWSPPHGHTGFKYFLEFADQNSVKRARALQLRDVKVHVVSYSPPLTARFTTIVPPPSSSFSPTAIKVESHDSERTEQYWQAGDTRAAQRIAERRPLPSPVDRDLSMFSGWPKLTSIASTDAGHSTYATLTRPPPILTERVNINKENGASRLDRMLIDTAPGPVPIHHNGAGTMRPASSPPNPRPVALPSRPSPRSRPVQLPTRVQGTGLPERPSPAQPAVTPGSPCIMLSYQGTPVPCDLDTLSESADGIIEVLKATAAQRLERDKWMIVAAHYRSKGNLRAAALVIHTMIDVMTSPAVGLKADELKPAFLMLSSCHTDLAKQLRAADGSSTEEGRKHGLEAARWLQQVYGAHVPPPPTDAERAAAKASMNLSKPAAESSSSAPAPVPGPSTPTARSCLANTSNLPSPAPTPTGASAHERRESGVSRGHILMLEREIQALRDRLADQGTQLGEARAGKRRMQEELDEERRVRRRGERQREQALVDARRAAEAEGEARRRAEELRDELAHVRRESQARLEECAEEDRRARECFGTLGVLFLKASKGELDGGVWKDALGRDRAPSANGNARMQE